MDWLKKLLTVDREAAIKEAGRQDGRAAAFQDAAEYLDPDKHCQVCGYRYWGSDDDKKKHGATHVKPE